MDQIRVMLADDHDLVRSMVRKFLEKETWIEVVGEACNGFEALEKVKQCHPDVLVLDMEMPGLNGVQVARKLKDQQSPVNILALSAYDDLNYIKGALENGASGYLLKDDLPNGFARLVKRVAQGEKGVLSDEIASKIKNRKTLQE
jgi:DNA-binding NarL/FixJ family response regulator